MLAWVDSVFEDDKERAWTRLAYTLGTQFEEEMFEEKKADGGKALPPDKTMRVPLSVAMRPELYQEMKKAFAARATSTPGGSATKTKSLGDVDRDTFMKFMGRSDNKMRAMADAARAAALDARKKFAE